jgi:hypothetical protein
LDRGGWLGGWGSGDGGVSGEGGWLEGGVLGGCDGEGSVSLVEVSD